MKRPIAHLVSLILSGAAMAAAAFLAAHHPISPFLALSLMGSVLVGCALFRHVWLALLPALLPVIDLAPWTGWLSFEEFDILVLAAASGAYLRRALASCIPRPKPLLIPAILWTAFFLSIATALYRGMLDAGGFQFGWFQGYEGPMNSLRLAKGAFMALLFVPLLREALATPEARGSRLLGWGMALGLAAAALAAVWERTAFTGLLNFSEDYRTTALFWEMHVGGAALDGFIALTMPFSVWTMMRARGPFSFGLAFALLALGAYAGLTMFSRGVYLAAVASFGVMLLLMARSRVSDGQGQGGHVLWVAVRVLFWIPVTLGLAYLAFRAGGYRVLLAMLGVFVLLLLNGAVLRAASGRQWAMAGLLAIPLAGGAWLVGEFLHKGVYWSYAGIFGLGFLSALVERYYARAAGKLIALAAVIALMPAAVWLAGHWGGWDAFKDAVWVLASLAVVAIWQSRASVPLWPDDLRWQGALFAAVAAMAATVAVFSGGAYMAERFATSERDLEGRLQHWHNGLALLQSPEDWWLGKGMGRFPSSFFFGAPGNEFPGSYRLGREGNNTYLTVSGPRFELGYGELLRVSQRIPPETLGRYRMGLDARTTRPATLYLDICEKHLLYRAQCVMKWVKLTPSQNGWQHHVVEMDARKLSPGPWYAPRQVSFSVAMVSQGGRADIDNLKLLDPLGNDVLVNADFSRDMARWFFTSDHHHMPWHMKSMFLHVLFEQGIVGLAVVSLLLIYTLSSLIAGRAAAHPLAPALAAALVGFVVVGLFDSLFDMPRITFLFYLVMLAALSLSGQRELPHKECNRREGWSGYVDSN
jgi:hypothetical protein